MITFNTVLMAHGLTPDGVRLMRHRHRRPRELFRAAVEGDARFEAYQSCQNTKVGATLQRASHMAAFVVEPGTSATMFAGVYRISSVTPGYHPDPFEPSGGPQQAGTVAVASERLAELDVYRGRLVIEWGAGERAWVQRAELRDKPILEIRREVAVPAFPGFRTFAASLGEIEVLPVGWKEVLRNARGVYLLVHRGRGEQYVGSASGSDGFLGRWLSYADGHGGNVGMRELGEPASEFDVSVLEVAGSAEGTGEIYARETEWKVRLGCRAHGLNRN